jgi:uncharacterized protein (DUF3820 family)
MIHHKTTYRLIFGKHKGEQICTIPASYLEWMKKTYSKPDHKQCKIFAEMANAELNRRKREEGESLRLARDVTPNPELKAPWED